MWRIAWIGIVLVLGWAHPAPSFAEWPPPWLKKKAPANPVFPRLLVEARELADSLAERTWTVVDARPAPRYLHDHLPGSRNIDARALAGRIEALGPVLSRAGVPPRGTLVVYSDRIDPAAAGELLWLLEASGRRGVLVLNGGMEAWSDCGGPTRCTPEIPDPERNTAQPDTSAFVDYERVRAGFGRPGITILDARGDSLWDAGHIPHSLPFAVIEAVDETGRIADGPTVRALIGAIGPRPNEFVDLGDRFIVTAGPETEGLPAHPYLLARLAGIADVKGYGEGFSGWALHPDAPVVTIVDAAHVKKRLGMRWMPGAKDRPPRDFILLDLRAEGEYKRGHLPGAVYIAPHEFQAQFEALVEEHWGQVDRRTIPIVFYCYGSGCVRSRNCSTWAAQMGFQHLEWFRDGALGWRQIGEELVE